MDPNQMNEEQLIEAIRSIIIAEPDPNTAGALIMAKLTQIMSEMGIGEGAAIERLAQLGCIYGNRGELGGVNIYCDDTGEFTRREFTDPHNSTFLTSYLTLGCLIMVHGYGNNPPVWFEPDWWLQEGTKDGSGLSRIFGELLSDPDNPIVIH